MYDNLKFLSTSVAWHKDTWESGDITPVILCLALGGGERPASNTDRFVLGV